MYEPKLARFTSRDPLVSDGTLLIDLRNLYAYVDNNPVSDVDPSGQSPTNANHYSDEIEAGESQTERSQCDTSPVVIQKRKCPECPIPWKPAPIPVFKNFKYGCYCGKEPTPPRKKIPPPIDPTDVCCKTHDECCGKAKTDAQKTKCNADLLKCVKIALTMTCADKAKNLKCCVDAATRIKNFYIVPGPKNC